MSAPEGEPRPEYCPCPLPAGWISVGGYHLRRMDRPSLMLREMHAFADRWKGRTREELRAMWERWWADEKAKGLVDEYGMHKSWAPYVGTNFAVCLCPEYAAALRGYEKRAAAAKAEKAVPAGGDLFGE